MTDPAPYQRVLAVDTSSMVQSVAVLDGDLVLTERTLKTRAGHSGALLAAIHAALGDVRVAPDDLDLLVCGAGPGSFTGLRIGLACLKAIAFARSLPLVTVSSLEALARGALTSPGLIAPIFDARKGELYVGLYRAHAGQLQAALSDRALPPEGVAEAILAERGSDEPVTLMGSGLRRHGATLSERLRPEVAALQTLGAGFTHVRASHLGALARARTRPADVPPLDTLEPNYQRASDAELNIR